MPAKPLMAFPSLVEGRLLKRYKRFLVDVELSNGQVVTAHCANTGPMRGVLHPGQRVRLRYSPSPNRKLSWTWEQAEVQGAHGTSCWVGVNTSLPNTLLRIAIETGLLNNVFGAIGQIRREVVYGRKNRSRIDLLLIPESSSSDSRWIYIEIKNTTWTDGSTAIFPDTVTQRGQKHLEELIDVLPQNRAVLIPCLSRSDVDIFAPGDTADLLYGKLFRKAIDAGVEVIPCCFGFHLDGITWEGQKPYLTHQPSLMS